MSPIIGAPPKITSLGPILGCLNSLDPSRDHTSCQGFIHWKGQGDLGRGRSREETNFYRLDFPASSKVSVIPFQISLATYFVMRSISGGISLIVLQERSSSFKLAIQHSDRGNCSRQLSDSERETRRWKM